MPASKVLETLLVCTCSAQSALSNDINDDFVCDKVEKKFSPSVAIWRCQMVRCPDPFGAINAVEGILLLSNCVNIINI